MDLENTKSLNPLDIVMFHVGGVGDYGPIEDIVNLFPHESVVVLFEANPSEDDYLTQERHSARGIRTVLVPKCVGDDQGKRKFYVNKHRESSSLFPPARQALEEHVLYPGINTWGENCELDYIVELETTTLDAMVKDITLPAPDVLSIDAQGAELRIMRGGERCITEDVMCVVSEVEFVEIYEGQDLFCAQVGHLSGLGFRLVDILNTQYWHPAPAAGLGFLTVGEVLFFRDIESPSFENVPASASLYKLIKLAAIAYAFRRFSYSSKIVTSILKTFGQEGRSLLLSRESFKPVLELHEYVQRNEQKYLRDNHFFYDHPPIGPPSFLRKGNLARRVVYGVTPPILMGPIKRIRRMIVRGSTTPSR